MNRYSKKSQTIISNESKFPKWTIGWGFSSYCDLNCPFCYSSKIRSKSPHSEIDLIQAEKFLVKNGTYIDSINFGTAECFASSKFFNILELCKELVPQVGLAVTTNGAIADLSKNELYFVKKFINECDISLDFVDQNMHDNWRGREGTWERAIKAIEISLELGLKTSIAMIGTIQTLNKENIKGLINLANSFQIATRINLYMPTSMDKTFIPSINSIFLLFEILKKNNNIIITSDRLFKNFTVNTLNENNKYKKYSCRILPDGTISPSTYLLEPPWIINKNLADISLLSILEEEPFKSYASPPIPKECIGCENLNTCLGGSIERRLLWSKNLENPDPLCPRLYYPKYSDIFLSSNMEISRASNIPLIHLDYLPTIVILPSNYKINYEEKDYMVKHVQ